jgi:hypothetical protein
MCGMKNIAETWCKGTWRLHDEDPGFSPGPDGPGPIPCGAAPQHVIVIAMENKDAGSKGPRSRNSIDGNMRDAPYINGEVTEQAARARPCPSSQRAGASRPTM